MLLCAPNLRVPPALPLQYMCIAFLLPGSLAEGYTCSQVLLNQNRPRSYKETDEDGHFVLLSDNETLA